MSLCNKNTKALRNEQRHSTQCSEHQIRQHKTKLDKCVKDHKSELDKCANKCKSELNNCEKEHQTLIKVQGMLAEEVKSWRQQYKELLVQSKDDLSDEREKRKL